MPERLTEEDLNTIVTRVSSVVLHNFMERVGPELVSRVSERVMADFYITVGRGVVKRVLWVIGVAATVLLMFMIGSGKVKIGD